MKMTTKNIQFLNGPARFLNLESKMPEAGAHYSIYIECRSCTIVHSKNHENRNYFPNHQNDITTSRPLIDSMTGYTFINSLCKVAKLWQHKNHWTWAITLSKYYISEFKSEIPIELIHMLANKVDSQLQQQIEVHNTQN